MATRRVICALLAAVGVAVGCVPLKRTPEARFFVLAPLAPPADNGRAPAEAVGLLAVRLPDHLLRPQLVTRLGGGELLIQEFHRWAEPLEQGTSRVLAENLEARLASYRVVRQPWPALTTLACRVGVEVSSFGPAEGGRVVLAGRYVVLPATSEEPLEAKPFRFERRICGPSAPEAVVGAMSELVGDLATTLGEAIGRATAPPTPFRS